MKRVVIFIFALVECAAIILIDWAILRFSGKVEMDAFAFMVACNALFLVCRKDLEEIRED